MQSKGSDVFDSPASITSQRLEKAVRGNCYSRPTRADRLDMVGETEETGSPEDNEDSEEGFCTERGRTGPSGHQKAQKNHQYCFENLNGLSRAPKL